MLSCASVNHLDSPVNGTAVLESRYELACLCLSPPSSVLEARIQQLQSDLFLDVKRSKLQVVNFSQVGKEVTPKKAQTSGKGGGPGPSIQKSNPSRWIEKLNREKSTKAKRILHHQQKSQEKSLKAKAHLPGTSKKIISPSKLSKASAKSALPRPGPPHKKAAKEELAKRAAAATPRDAKSQPREKEPAEVEKLELQPKPSQLLPKDRPCGPLSDAQASVRCYLEACMFTGDINRAQLCLLSHHQHMARRKLLCIGTYNYMMRVWAKRVSPGCCHSVRHFFCNLTKPVNTRAKFMN